MDRIGNIVQQQGFNYTPTSLMKNCKLLVWLLVAVGSLIRVDNSLAGVVIKPSSSSLFVSASHSCLDKPTLSCQSQFKSIFMPGLGSTGIEVSDIGFKDPLTSETATATANTSISVISLADGVEFTEVAGSVINIGPGLLSRIGMAAGSSINGRVSLVMDIPEPKRVTLELGINASVQRTEQTAVSSAFLRVSTIDSSGHFQSFSDSLSCNPNIPCTRNTVSRYDLDVVPGQEIFVFAYTGVNTGSLGTTGPISTSSAQATYTIRVIEQTECQGLTLDLFPSFPDTIWPTLLPSGSHDNTALIETKISTPAPPGGCVVNLNTEPVTAKGHSHSLYLIDKAGKIEMGGKTITSCTIPEGETTCRAADGSISPVIYTAPEISGEEKITATLKDTGEKASKSIFAMVPDLGPLSSLQFYRLTGSAGTPHTDNHYATNDTIFNIQGMAQDYFDICDEDICNETLGINDMTLPWGGLFDINGDWKTPHGMIVGVEKHRIGKAVDIDRCAQTLVMQRYLDRIAKKHSGDRIVEEALEVPGCEGPADTPRIHYDFP